ncbi:DUF1707 SHOCT-like domain-containing protein [Gordonia insulae]|uniref:DUF1707 domain-containing protein n=1 Tax=Gordonia insulae TaxID=2420509 RepID=A0A3G8JU90_9ACTN|nr:DUF1707 domain-containing protein [Gordonia insulae]AZG48637.1 hypothetical protein D7316_05257 [Gordonia insulae]
MAEDHSDDHLRVGNPERERAITLLNDALSGGYLEIAEFDDRSQLIYTAKTRADLRAVLEHLPVATHLFPDSQVGYGAEPASGVPSVAPVAEFTVDWETLRRKGIWQVPANILVTGSMGTVDLDFTNATLPGPVIDLALQVSTSTVKLRLGPDHEIRYAALTKTGWSSIKDKGGPPTRPGGAVINVTGSISAMSGVTIKRA